MNDYRNIKIETEHGPLVVQFRDDIHAGVWNIGSSEAGYLGSYTPFTERGSEFSIHATMKREGDDWVFDNWSNVQYADYRRKEISQARRQRFEHLIADAIKQWIEENPSEWDEIVATNKRTALEFERLSAKTHFQDAKYEYDHARRALDESVRQLTEVELKIAEHDAQEAGGGNVIVRGVVSNGF